MLSSCIMYVHMTKVYDYCIVNRMAKIQCIHNFMRYTNCDSKEQILTSDDIYIYNVVAGGVPKQLLAQTVVKLLPPTIVR